MLTALSVKPAGQPKARPKVLYAPELLAMLQQALPGVQKPEGNGVLEAPWVPKTPSEWWFCAKEKPKRMGYSVTSKKTGETHNVTTFNETLRFWNDKTDLAWLKVGGKYISIKPDSLYASQHAAPARGTNPAVPSTTFEDLTYSQLYATISDETSGVKDQATAQQIRQLLNGGNGGAAVLPLLTSVLFVSEVARNHTAFHTNLMMLDLVQKRVAITQGTPFTYSFHNVLWNPTIIDSVMELRRSEQSMIALNNQKASLDALFEARRNRERLSYDERDRLSTANGPRGENQWIRSEQQGERDAQRNAKNTMGTAKQGMDELNHPRLASRGGEGAQPGGLASMSHKGSAWGAAYDLENEGEYRGVNQGGAFRKPATAMTIVRRKEATLLIRWLEHALNATGKFQAVAMVDDPHLETAGVYSRIENAFGTSDAAYLTALELMQKRVNSFDLLL